MFKKVKNIHFIGIGGAGMSGIAEVLLNEGYHVSGSDAAESETTRRLSDLGTRVFVGHRAQQVEEAHVVVVSSAIAQENPEMARARELNIPIVPRAEMLCEIARLKYTVAVAGTHGKTTTTSMVGSVLVVGGLDPTLVVGGRLKTTQSGARLGQGDYLVAEADESDGSFLKLSPSIAIITNIDNDHLDYYKTMEKLESAFADFANRVPFYGLSILCFDDARCRRVAGQIKRRCVSYGFAEDVDYRACDLKVSPSASTFKIFQKDRCLGSIALQVPGRHNVLNALAALAAGLELDISFEQAAQGLSEFQSVGRRLEIRGENSGVLIIDDYGHHPTEIRCTLSAIRERWPRRRLIVLFQPHRYTRTQLLAEEFGRCFGDADEVHVLPIYAAGEKPIKGVSSSLILKHLNNKSASPKPFDPDSGLSTLLSQVKPRDIILTLGAGDVWKLGLKILDAIPCHR